MAASTTRNRIDCPPGSVLSARLAVTQILNTAPQHLLAATMDHELSPMLASLEAIAVQIRHRMAAHCSGDKNSGKHMTSFVWSEVLTMNVLGFADAGTLIRVEAAATVWRPRARDEKLWHAMIAVRWPGMAMVNKMALADCSCRLLYLRRLRMEKNCQPPIHQSELLLLPDSPKQEWPSCEGVVPIVSPDGAACYGLLIELSLDGAMLLNDVFDLVHARGGHYGESMFQANVATRASTVLPRIPCDPLPKLMLSLTVIRRPDKVYIPLCSNSPLHEIDLSLDSSTLMFCAGHSSLPAGFPDHLNGFSYHFTLFDLEFDGDGMSAENTKLLGFGKVRVECSVDDDDDDDDEDGFRSLSGDETITLWHKLSNSKWRRCNIGTS